MDEEKLLRDLCAEPAEGEDDWQQKLAAAQGAKRLAWELPENPEVSSRALTATAPYNAQPLYHTTDSHLQQPLPTSMYLGVVRRWAGRSSSSLSACC